MDPSSLIPATEAIPAPWWVMETLGVLVLIFHLLVVNVALGGSLLLLWNRLRGGCTAGATIGPEVLKYKLPTAFAVGINLGVAPLLFTQVLYGHFFYTSSIIMAVSWIMVIPLVILGYYGAHTHARKYASRPGLALAALVVACAVLLYVPFAFENNISLELQPERWSRWFENRGGTALSLSDPVMWGRYLHFVTASLAVAGLFIALVWGIRGRRGRPDTAPHVRRALRIYALTNMVQVVIGLALLMLLPRRILLQFMGGDLLYSGVLLAGFSLALAGIFAALQGRLWTTVALTVGIVTMMVLTRTFLRHAYLEPWFDPASLPVEPRYGVLALFLATLAAGLAIVGVMLKWAIQADSAPREAA